MFTIKAIILAAGYATRLYPLTKDTPKPLLNIAGKPIINYIYDEIVKIPEIDHIYIVTNDRFYKHFIAWLQYLSPAKPVTIVNDHTTSNGDRLGAIGDLLFAIQQEKIADDLLVIAGDNLFGFSLTDFVQSFQQHNKSSIVAFRNLQDKAKVKGRFGVGMLEDNNRVVDFEEKPQEPKSALAATACYLFSQSDIVKIESLFREEKADAPGNIIKYLANNSAVYGFIFNENWFDVGTPESLAEAERYYEH